MAEVDKLLDSEGTNGVALRIILRFKVTKRKKSEFSKNFPIVCKT